MNIDYPLASKKIMSDGEKIFYAISEETHLDVDLTNQCSFIELVEPYCKKLNFDGIDLLAERFWPLGKSRDVVVDPHHRFGEPTIKGTNISVDLLPGMAKRGEKIETIAQLYSLQPQQIKDAIAYSERTSFAA